MYFPQHHGFFFTYQGSTHRPSNTNKFATKIKGIPFEIKKFCL